MDMSVRVRARYPPHRRLAQSQATAKPQGQSLPDRKSTRLNSSHGYISYAVFCLKKKSPGSLHGYDIIDHDSLNPEIGTSEDFDALVRELKRHGMALMIDVVPNHMGVFQADNGWWLDVLENWPASHHVDYFDLDWAPLSEELRDKALLPILGGHYGTGVERGDLTLT